MAGELDHPNILTFSEMYEDEENIYLVMELMLGELYDSMVKLEKFNENDAASIVY